MSGICACMGPMYGEPYCYCQMEDRGLPMDGPIRKAAEEKSQAERKKLWEPGGWFYEENKKRIAEGGEP